MSKQIISKPCFSVSKLLFSLITAIIWVMNKALQSQISTKDRVVLDNAVKKIVKKYHKTLIKLANT